ncbi:hypothetical protein ACQ0MK_09990 [Thalassospira lucentensis]|uniref:hypothetical protein n=1 Tax=Thalassospira lucentensis TaxID=168935 RepID=UPI003D2EB407
MTMAVSSLAACVGTMPAITPMSDLSCRDQLTHVDGLIEKAGVRNAAGTPVVGYPFLRANRNSVVMGKQVAERDDQGLNDKGLFKDWIAQMRQLDRQARASEVQNLPVGHGISIDAVENCANQLVVDLTLPDFAPISTAVFIPDDYLDFQRIAGLYPLPAFAAHFGYEGWKRENLQSFGQSPSVFASSGFWRGYVASNQGVKADAGFIADLPRDGFGRLVPTSVELEKIAQTYAPELRVREASDSDRIGRPVLATRDAISEIDTTRPTIFYRLNHGYFNGNWYPQIVYSVWFPERPENGMFDILAGHLDALVWRVTLDHDGRPLIADSIHGCGCYHLFFPGNGLKRIQAPEDGDIRETAESPAGFVDGDILTHPVLWVDAMSHYLMAVTATENTRQPDATSTAELILEQSLTSVKLDDGTGYASLYDEDGFVPGTDRLERFILWPLGIERPGAMRQWGHHTTAFVGRRHFDEPGLIGRYFAPRDLP